MLLDLGGKFLSWLGDVLPQLPGKLLEWTKAILGALGSLLKDIAPRLANLAAGMWHWLTVDAIPQLVANLPKFAEAIWSKITQVIQELPSHLVNLIKGMWNWLTDVLPKLGSALGDLSGKLWAWITAVLQTLPGKVGEIGKAIVTGIWDGVKALWDGFTKWIRGLLSTLADDAKKTINQIFNPSWRDAQGNPGLDPNHLPGSGSTPHFGGGGGGVPFVPPIAIPGGHGAGEGSSGGGSSSNGMQVINNFTLHSNDTRLVQTIRDEIGKTQMQVQNWQNS